MSVPATSANVEIDGAAEARSADSAPYLDLLETPKALLSSVTTNTVQEVVIMGSGAQGNPNWLIDLPALANVEPLDPTKQCGHCGSEAHKFWECPDAVYYDDPAPRAPVEPRAAPPEGVQRIAPRTRAVRTRRASTTSPPAGDGDGDDDGEGVEEGGGRRRVVLGPIRVVPVDQLRLHPDAELVPEMRPVEYAALVQDVYERGVQVPLEVHGGLVLDGRHRLRAAWDAGLDSVPVIEVAPPEDDPDGTAHMLKAALLRRHLSDDQRALMAARWAKAHPVPRGGDRKSAKVRAIKQAHVGKVDPTPGRTNVASIFGVAPTRVKKAGALLSTAPELAAKVEAGELKLGQALGSLKRKEQLAGIERATLPAGTFRTIVADPPWRYEDKGCSGAAEGHYPTMSVEKICALPIREHAADDAHLYLWVTNPHLETGFRVLRAWGFRYVTTLTWKKPRLGLGRYHRSQTEHVLFGVRGTLPLKAQDISNFFEAPQGRHSEKPEEFAALVERASTGPYLELFARRQRPGWICWGAEAGAAPANGGPAGIIGTTPEVKPEGDDS